MEGFGARRGSERFDPNNYYNKSASDGRYYQKSQTWSRSEADARYLQAGAFIENQTAIYQNASMKIQGGIEMNGTLRVNGGSHTFKNSAILGFRKDDNDFSYADGGFIYFGTTGQTEDYFQGNNKFVMRNSAGVVSVFGFYNEVRIGEYVAFGTKDGGEYASFKAYQGVGVRYLAHFHPEINLTGGTSTYRGIYYNPTLTATVGLTHYAMDLVSGHVLLNSSSGLTKIGNGALTGDQLQVYGSAYFSSTIKTGDIGGSSAHTIKLGQVKSGGIAVISPSYWEVEVNGTTRMVALRSS